MPIPMPIPEYNWTTCPKKLYESFQSALKYHVLILSGTLSNNEMVHTLSFLEANQSIKTLRLVECCIQPTEWSLLGNNLTLSTLDISKCSPMPDFTILANMQHLLTLNMSEGLGETQYYNNDDLEALTKNTTLTNITLLAHRVEGEGYVLLRHWMHNRMKAYRIQMNILMPALRKIKENDVNQHCLLRKLPPEFAINIFKFMAPVPFQLQYVRFVCLDSDERRNMNSSYTMSKGLYEGTTEMLETRFNRFHDEYEEYITTNAQFNSAQVMPTMPQQKAVKQASKSLNTHAGQEVLNFIASMSNTSQYNDDVFEQQLILIQNLNQRLHPQDHAAIQQALNVLTQHILKNEQDVALQSITLDRIKKVRDLCCPPIEDQTAIVHLPPASLIFSTEASQPDPVFEVASMQQPSPPCSML